MKSKTLPSKGGQKAQAALEYLITYGWALIVIATVIGVLVFAASGGVNTNTCTTFLTIVCKGIGVDGDTLIMVLQNATGQTISITPFSDICFDDRCGYAAIEYGGTTYRFESVEIPAGAEFRILGYGQVLAGEVSITYVEEETGLTKTVESTVGTEADEGIEISNDGIDNDGIEGIDCEQGGVSTCIYVEEETIPPVTFSAGSGTFEFDLPPLTGNKIEAYTLAIYAEDFDETNNLTVKLLFGFPPVTRNITKPPSELKVGWNYFSESSLNINKQGVVKVSVDATSLGSLTLPTNLENNKFAPKLVLDVVTLP